MKRHPTLHPLSREHHTVLLWCQRLRWHAEGNSRAPTQAVVLDELHALLPTIQAHFEIEEQLLFPLGDSIGGEQDVSMVARLRADHAHWQQQLPAALAAAPTDMSLLVALTRHLHDHVRYEERVFFEFLQAHLSDIEWQRLTEELAL